MSVVPMARECQLSEGSGPLIRAARAARRAARLATRSAIRAVGWILREAALRREMRRLAEFDDHMLRDLGVARSNIEGAVRRGHDGTEAGTPPITLWAAGPRTRSRCRPL